MVGLKKKLHEMKDSFEAKATESSQVIDYLIQLLSVRQLSQSACSPATPSVCPSIRPSIRPSVSQSVNQSVSQSVSQSVILKLWCKKETK